MSEHEHHHSHTHTIRPSTSVVQLVHTYIHCTPVESTRTRTRVECTLQHNLTGTPKVQQLEYVPVLVLLQHNLTPKVQQLCTACTITDNRHRGYSRTVRTCTYIQTYRYIIVRMKNGHRCIVTTAETDGGNATGHIQRAQPHLAHVHAQCQHPIELFTRSPNQPTNQPTAGHQHVHGAVSNLLSRTINWFLSSLDRGFFFGFLVRACCGVCREFVQCRVRTVRTPLQFARMGMGKSCSVMMMLTIMPVTPAVHLR